MPDCTAGDLSVIIDQARSQAAERELPGSALEEWRYTKTDVLRDPQLDATTDTAEAIERAQALLTGIDLGAGFWVVDGKYHSGPSIQGVAFRDQPSAEDCSLWQGRMPSFDDAELWSFSDAQSLLALELSGLIDEPLTVVNVVTGGRQGWRFSIESAPGSAASLRVITVHLGFAWLNVGVDVKAAPGSNIQISEWEVAADSVGIACHTKRLAIAQDAHVGWCGGYTGGALQRHTVHAALLGTGADVSLGASTLVGEGRQCHHLVRVRHHVGKATSRQAFKTVADGNGLASFDGIIHVDHGADGTDAFQAANGLEIGPKARIAARPQLDIYTDEVVASHGATVGQPDPDEVRYLLSRGLDQRTATALIVDGFITDGLSGMKDEALRTISREQLLNILHSA